MSNEDFQWLERYSQSQHLRHLAQQYRYGAPPSKSQDVLAPPFPLPPMSTSQASTSNTPSVYPYSAPYIPHTYVRPEDATYHYSYYPQTTHSDDQQDRGNSSATAPPPASVPTPTPIPPAPASAPPPPPAFSNPIAATQKLPSDTTMNGTVKPPSLHDSLIVAHPPGADPGTLGHDVKRRRVESPAATTTSKPPAMPREVLSPYYFKPQDNPQDTTNKDNLKPRINLAQRLNEADAADKVTYDPRTIARDVLIASGRHPTEAPLNHHLLRLRFVFPGLEAASDLETFRWDLVDPPESPVDPMDKSRDQTSLPTAPAETRPTQSNLLHRPEAPYPPQQPVQPKSYEQPYQQPRTTHASQSQHQQRSDLKSSPQIQIAAPPQPSPQPPVPRVQLTSNPQAQVQVQTRPHPQLQSHAHPAAQTTAKPQTPSQRKRLAPPSPNMVGKRGPGRPPASSKVEVTIPVSSQVPYQVYACEWEGCQAELHNLEMLKKHISKVHVPYHLECKWKDCKVQESLPAIRLYTHVLTDHVASIAWKLGDGPSVPGTEGRGARATPGPKTIPDSIQPSGEDSLIFPASYSSIRAFNRVHGKYTQTEKAREILKGVQRLKEHIGFGLDPGGCELATPARNKRVSNDEDFLVVRHES